MTEVLNEARAMIERRIAELDQERRSLEAALKELDKGRPARTGRRRRSARKTKPKAGKGQRREEVVATVKGQPGITAAELAREIGASPSQVHQILKALRKERLVRKRGPKYSAA